MSRKAARETAMKLIFAQNFGGGALTGEEDELFLIKNPDEEPVECLDLTDEDTSFMDCIVEGAMREKDAIYRVIEEGSIGWKLERMPKVDLAILQLAVYELLYTDITLNIAINEAVELAKKYSTADSASFINGLLAKVVKDRNQ